jgi:hypothetical protein
VFPEARRAMRNVFLVLAWVFVVFVAVYDVYFAWEHQAFFDVWELNPFARWIAQDYGLNVLFLFKIGMLGFGVVVAAYCHLRRHYLELPYTLIVSVVHLLLSLHYLISQTASI